MTKIREDLQGTVRVVAPLALFVFLVGAVAWFIAIVWGDQTISAADAFVGLGYLAGVLLVALLAMLGWQLLGLIRGGEWRWRRRENDSEHSIIRAQMAWGSMLVIVGAVVGLICLCFVDPSEEVAGPVLALATAVISAGAVLLPAGAAGSASSRLQQQAAAETSLPVVGPPVVVRKSGTTAELSGTVAPNRAPVTAYFEFQELPEADDVEPTAAIAKLKETPIAATVPAQTIKDELTDLKREIRYHVRVVAKRADGTAVESDWVELPAGPSA